MKSNESGTALMKLRSRPFRSFPLWHRRVDMAKKARGTLTAWRADLGALDKAHAVLAGAMRMSDFGEQQLLLKNKPLKGNDMAYRAAPSSASITAREGEVGRT